MTSTFVTALASLKRLRDIRSSAEQAMDLIDAIDVESVELDALALMLRTVLRSDSESGFGLDDAAEGLAVVAETIRIKTLANTERAHRLWQIAKAGQALQAALDEEVRAEQALRAAEAAVKKPVKRKSKAA